MRPGLCGWIVCLLASTALAQTPPVPPMPLASAPVPAPQPVLAGPAGMMPPSIPDAGSPGILRSSLPTQEASADPFLIWANCNFLLWQFKQAPAPPPLVTTGPVGAASPAVLGQPGTQILYGDSTIDYGHFSGGRWDLGAWCTLCQSIGFELSGLALEKRSRTYFEMSDAAGSPILARPFINAQQDAETAVYAAFPDRFGGVVNVSSSSRLWGLELTALSNQVLKTVESQRRSSPWGDFRLDVLGGFRYLDLNESLNVFQGSIVLPDGVANFAGQTVGPSNLIAIQDSFGTHNYFLGAQVGTRMEFTRDRLILRMLAKVAVGSTHQSMRINGNSTLAPVGISTANPGMVVIAGPPATVPGGLLATATNIGHYERNRVSVVPEVSAQIGYQLDPSLRVFVGYTFLYWSDVIRPGNQVDRTVNLTQVPIHPSYGPLVGPIRPTAPFQSGDFWAQGINFGFELRY
ncbi:MAG: BBP7 family outer membrane beta-barrel protein [Gemmataceae bacterium]|nr:BBP7 family outer membrane beta-barrel protein [Gemmataceae bacterium]